MNAETKRCFAALLRKQRREQSAFLNRSARTGKQRTQTGKFAFGVLYGAVALVLMASFASLSWPLAQLLLPGGWETLYFLVLELLALLVSVLAGALSSYNRLFQAKDNDLLLALPIPPWMIFAVRLCGLYEMSLFYLLLVWVPAEAAYARFAPHPLGGILSAVPMALLLAGAASVLAALLGWAVALLVAKAGRHKALFTVAASLGFLALYFLGYQKSGALLNALLSSALWGGGEGLPQGGWLLLGRAACGDIPALLGLLISLAAVCAVLGKLLSGPYLRLMTTRTGGAASKMKAAPSRRVSVRRALLRRELLHLAGSPTYLLNCAMGSLGLVVLSVLALYKAGEIRLLAVQLLPPGLAGAAAAFAAAPWGGHELPDGPLRLAGRGEPLAYPELAGLAVADPARQTGTASGGDAAARPALRGGAAGCGAGRSAHGAAGPSGGGALRGAVGGGGAGAGGADAQLPLDQRNGGHQAEPLLSAGHAPELGRGPCAVCGDGGAVP